MFEQFLIITPLLWATNTWHKPGHPGAVVHWHHDHHYHHLVSVLCWELGLRDNHHMIQFYCNRETTTAGRTGDADKKLMLVFWQHEVAVEGGIDMNHAMITQQPMAHGKIQLMLAVLAEINISFELSTTTDTLSTTIFHKQRDCAFTNCALSYDFL